MKPNPQADPLLLRHMLDCVENILADTDSRREIFFGSRTVRDAVLRNLQTLTESSQRLSDEAKAAELEVPWRQMSATRNILVYDYLGGIDPETVWTFIERDLPVLRAALERMIARADAQNPAKDNR